MPICFISSIISLKAFCTSENCRARIMRWVIQSRIFMSLVRLSPVSWPNEFQLFLTHLLALEQLFHHFAQVVRYTGASFPPTFQLLRASCRPSDSACRAHRQNRKDREEFVENRQANGVLDQRRAQAEAKSLATLHAEQINRSSRKASALSARLMRTPPERNAAMNLDQSCFQFLQSELWITISVSQPAIHNS